MRHLPLLLALSAPLAAAGPALPQFADFDELPSRTLSIGDSRIRLGFSPGLTPARTRVIVDWTKGSAQALAGYLGRFPVPEVFLLLATTPGEGITGTTWGHPRPPSIRVVVGEDAADGTVRSSWVMAHELVHLAVPEMAGRHGWLNEGLATYVEPVARAQAGELPVPEVWRWLVRGTPRGLPREGDRGLDHTRTWGRTYWGGALFCLLADVEIHRRTGNRYGLQDALRGALAAGANNQVRWTVERFLSAGDEAVGVPVLMELYRAHRDTAVTPDLDGLFRSLGVELSGGTVVFDDGAPDAAIRRAITRPRRAP